MDGYVPEGTKVDVNHGRPLSMVDGKPKVAAVNLCNRPCIAATAAAGPGHKICPRTTSDFLQ